MEQTINALIETAKTLAAIQVEKVIDYTGFSSADKNVGAFLANVVETDPSNEEAITSLASLVGVKYKRQTEGLVGAEMAARFKALAKGGKLTPEQRHAARKTIVSKIDVHPTYGTRLLLSFQFNETFGDIIRNNGGRCFHGEDGWKWIVLPEAVERTIATLKSYDANIVGETSLGGIPAASIKATAPKVSAKLEGKVIRLSFAYNASLVTAVKQVQDRRFDSVSKAWTIPAKFLTEAISFLEPTGADLSAMHALSDVLPPVHQTVSTVYTARETILSNPKIHDYQKTGIDFICKDFGEEKTTSPRVRGVILGDDMGMGKTLQTIVASDGIAGPDGHILIVCPASVKINWQREINIWIGYDETVHVIRTADCDKCNHGAGHHSGSYCQAKVAAGDQKWLEKKTDKKGNVSFIEHKVMAGATATLKMIAAGIAWAYCGCEEKPAGGFDASCRWNIINYDLLSVYYQSLLENTIDVLAVDEAHYIKNRESDRSSYMIGGQVTLAQKPTKKDLNVSRSHKIEGLCSHAEKRVILLTGTPMENRPKDLFNLLRGVGHQHGNNFMTFGRKFCDPVDQIGKYGKKFGTTYNGATNMKQLAEDLKGVFLQRKKEDYLKDLPSKQRQWLPVEVDLKDYQAVMDEYDTRREAGELSKRVEQLALLNEARMCAAISKIPATIEQIENALESGRKVLVFTEYVKVLDALQKKFKDISVRVDGTVTEKPRQAAVDDFQTNPEKTVFLGQLLAAGTGINLQAGSVVIFNDTYWTPAKHLQAEDRAYRMGQTKQVNVYYVVAAGTFDEEMAVMTNEKLEAINDFEGTDVQIFDDLVKKLAEAPKNEAVATARKNRARKVKKGL